MAAPTAPRRVSALAQLPRIGSRPWFKSSQRILGRDWPTAYLFVLPTVLLLFGLIGYPFFRAVYLSFHNAVGVRSATSSASRTTRTSGPTASSCGRSW